MKPWQNNQTTPNKLNSCSGGAGHHDDFADFMVMSPTNIGSSDSTISPTCHVGGNNNKLKDNGSSSRIIRKQAISEGASSSGNKSDSDSGREDGMALKNDVKLSNPALLSPNLNAIDSKKGVRNALISEMANLSPVHIPHVDNGKFLFFIVCIFFFLLMLLVLGTISFSSQYF